MLGPAPGMIGDMRTRVIELAAGQDRRGAENLRTVAVIDPPWTPQPGHPPQRTAMQRLAYLWPQVHRAIAGGVGPGVAVVAVDTSRDRVAGSMWIAAKPGAINAGIVGRHGQCDLFLDGDGSMSLRHLVVIVDPARDWGGPGGSDVRYRLLDLRTSTAFCDEEGRRLEAITALGPAFVRVGRYLLYCFPTGVEDWPAEADAALAAMPERIYIEDRDAEPDQWQRRRPSRLAEGSKVHDPLVSSMRTQVTAVPGPARARVDVVDDQPAMGRLEIRSRLGADAVPVGELAAQRGILLGRYSRCDTAGATSLALERISRVHVIVVAVEGRLWMIDAASTNGMTTDGHDVRVQPLRPDAEVELGGVGTVRWVPNN